MSGVDILCGFAARLLRPECPLLWVDALPLLSILVLAVAAAGWWIDTAVMEQKSLLGLVLVAALLVVPPFLLTEPRAIPGGGPGRGTVELIRMDCYTHIGNGSTGGFIIELRNDGERPLPVESSSFTVTMADGTLNSTLSHQDIGLTGAAVTADQDSIALLRTGGTGTWPGPASYAVYQFNASETVRLNGDMPYYVELTFGSDYMTVADTCRASQQG